MIQLNELRIGNIIWDGEEFNRVYQLDTGGISFFRINDAGVNKDTGAAVMGGHIRFRPVNLTYELLTRACGFIDPAHNGKGCRIQINETDELCWYNDERSLRFQTRGSGFTRNFGVIYLHQLQNLHFVITGQELPVNI